MSGRSATSPAGLYACGSRIFYVATDGAAYLLRGARGHGLWPVAGPPASSQRTDRSEPELDRLIAFAESGAKKRPIPEAS